MAGVKPDEAARSPTHRARLFFTFCHAKLHLMKRFWEAALAVPRLEGGYGVELDGRPLRLPGGSILTIESRPLAEAIADEWQQAGGAKGGEMNPEDVALTRLLG